MLNKTTLTAAALAVVLATPAFAQSPQADKPKSDAMQQTQSSAPQADKGQTTGQNASDQKSGGSTEMKASGENKGSGSMDKNADKSAGSMDKNAASDKGSMDKADKAAGSMDKSQGSMAKKDTAGKKQPGFVQKQDAGEWRASKLIGSSVYGPKDESIGDINELLIAKDGGIEAVVVGVGGFLGIGEKNVAIPFDALNVQRKPDSGAIEKITASYSKDQLKNAPEFAYFEGERRQTTGANPAATPGARPGAQPGAQRGAQPAGPMNRPEQPEQQEQKPQPNQK